MKQSKSKEVSRIGESIRRERRCRDLSQEQLAERAEITSNYISLFETGKRCASIDVYLKIANGLDLRLSELFSEKKKNVDVVDEEGILKIFFDASPFERRVMIAGLTATKNALRL